MAQAKWFAQLRVEESSSSRLSLAIEPRGGEALSLFSVWLSAVAPMSSDAERKNLSKKVGAAQKNPQKRKSRVFIDPYPAVMAAQRVSGIQFCKGPE